LLRNRRFLSNLAEAVEKAPVPSIILNHGASITLSTLTGPSPAILPPSRGRKNTFVDQLLPEPNAMVEINLENADGSTATRRYARQHWPIPMKVPRPLMTPGIKQRHYLPGPGIDTTNVRPFVAVARKAAQAKVAGFCRTRMIFRDDVIDLEG
jgi:hypothetical protein